MAIVNSDNLGTMGEGYFQTICASVGLICNKSTHDRTGWDYIIELPIPTNVLLDSRPMLPSAHCQLKTVKSTTTTVTLRLSSAERLAKEPKPSFIYVFKVDDNLNFVEAYFLHLTKDSLSKVLKRLREERAKPNAKPINKQTISFQLSAMTPIAPTGAALKAMIEQICPDMASYMADKKAQLDKLGFAASPYEMTTAFKVSSMDELADGFLGLKPLKVSNFRSFETRFGIKLSMGDAKKGIIHFKPGPADTCRVSVQAGPLSPPVTFEAEIFVTPHVMPAAAAKYLIRHPLFEITVRKNGMTFNFTEEMVTAAPRTVAEWLTFARFQEILMSGTGTLSITPNKFPPVTIPNSFKHDKEEVADIHGMVRLLESAVRVFEVAGGAASLVHLESLVQSQKAVATLHALLEGRLSPASISFAVDIHDDTSLPGSPSALIVNVLDVAGLMVAYAADADMDVTRDQGKASWRSRAIRPLRLAVITDLKDDYKRFVERVRSEAKSEVQLIADFDGPEADALEPSHD